mmetsp:Transcript_16106/g.32948  ORF Transcript_16106/g.32948 Transcript_16106/m.32948 type:complete len:323 (-) Transcript_16106:137-1105(-)
MAPTDPTRDPSTQSSHANNSSSNWLEEFVDWLESLDVPKMNTYQKCLVGLVLTTVLLVVVTTFTGHFYLAAVAFSKAIDGMSMFGLTATLFCVVATAEVVGVNTTMLALAVGYVYGRRFDDVGHATLVASLVSFTAVCVGCVAAYGLGATCLSSWALELRNRNRVFEALDTVLGEQGLKVNLLLRLTMPDSFINFVMACSRCSFLNFVGGFTAMVPWIVAHAWYGAQIETLTDKSKVGSEQDELVTLIVGLAAATLLATVLLVYTKAALARMIQDVEVAQRSGTEGSDASDPDSRNPVRRDGQEQRTRETEMQRPAISDSLA